MGRTSDARERLVNAAVSMIRATSYNSVSVDELCRQADVRKGSFYHFFPSKRDLAVAAVDSWWESFSHDLLEPAFQSDVPPRERIIRCFEAAAQLHARVQERIGKVQGCPVGNMSVELSAQDELLRVKLDEALQRFAGYFQTALTEGIAQGDMPADMDVEGVSRGLLAFFYGSIMLAKTSNDAGVMKTLAGQVSGLIPGPAEVRLS